MNPRHLKSPAALFGPAAMESARTLKRAYARMVRKHPPEADPDVFEHVRRMYERGVDELKNKAAPVAISLDADVKDLDPGEVCRQLDPDDWRSTLHTLTRMARAGNLPAIETGYSILAALAPAEALAWLQGLLDVPGAEARIVDLLHLAFEIMPGRSRDPAMDPLLEAMSPDAAARVVVIRLRRLTPFHATRAAMYWQRDQAHLVRRPDAMVAVLLGPMGGIRWHLPADDLRQILEQLDDVRLDLDDWAYDMLLISLHAALAAAAMDPVEHAAVRRALMNGHRVGRVAAVAALRDLAQDTPDMGALLDGLADDHPGVYAAVHDMLETSTQQQNYLEAWAEAHVAPAPSDVPDSRWLGDVREFVSLSYVAAPRSMESLLGVPNDNAWVALACGLIGMSFLVAFGLGLPIDKRLLGGVTVLFGVAGYMIMDGRRTVRTAAALGEDGPWTVPKGERSAVGMEIVRRGAQRGYWPHEVAAAMDRMYGTVALAASDGAVGDPSATIALITDAHVRRIISAEAAEQEDDA